MNYRQSFRKSKLAFWGFRLAVISAHIVVFTLVLHRYAGQSTAVALNLMQIGFIGAFVALIMCLVAAIHIWNKLLSGFGKSIAGVFLSLLVLVWPLSQLPVYLTTPQNYDVSTSLKEPPQFKTLIKFREFGSNAINFVERNPFHPEVLPLRIMQSGQDAYDIVRQLVIRRKWEIVASTPPTRTEPTWTIEAVDRSLILAVPDDIIIRIQSRGNQSVMDMRSQARYGAFDLGRNERRIRQFLSDLISQNTEVSLVQKDERLFLPLEKKRQALKKTNSKKVKKKKLEP